jgi:formate/nitrite transporter
MEKHFLTPSETTHEIAKNGARVMTQPLSKTILLSLLAGFYIAFGAQLATVITHDTAANLGIGVSRFIGGSVFSLGLMLVIICGAELFTGNTLLAKAAFNGEIPWNKLWQNWSVVILGNMVGSLFFAWLMLHSQLLHDGNVAAHAMTIAETKSQLSFTVALTRGILCNWLVCLAIFMATSAQNVSGKILACYVPIMAFVASGFEHSVANMYFIPTGIFLSDSLALPLQGLTWGGFIKNIIPVTMGNILGGVVFVAFTYWFIHLKDAAQVSD